MAEKKRQYSRALAQKRCLEAIERAILINKSEAERPFVFQVQELVVFGPLVDTDAPTVHGVDILATTARHHRYQNRDEAFHSDNEDFILDILPTAKAGGFLHQPPLRSNRSCCVLHDVRQALLPVCPTVRYVLV